MIISKAQYTVNADYVEHNKANIVPVVEALRALNRTDISYRIFVEEDGKTFVHLPRFASEEAEQVFSSLPTFKVFLSELQDGHFEVPPKTVKMNLVASTLDLL